MRVHRDPRVRLFVPTEAADAPPIALDKINVARTTATKASLGESQRIIDCWDGTSPGDRRELPYTWTGETTFQIVGALEAATEKFALKSLVVAHAYRNLRALRGS